MKRNKIFLVVILSLFVIFLMAFLNYSEAAFSLTDMESQAKEFLDKGESQYSVDDKKIQGIVVPVAQILVMIGNIVVVIAITVIGIKYIMSNPEDKAKLKTQLVGVVVATIVIFGAQIIWRVAYSFLSTL